MLVSESSSDAYKSLANLKRCGDGESLAPPPHVSSSLGRIGGGNSNTSSKWYIENIGAGFRVVHFGIDTLRVGMDFEWDQVLHDKLLFECERGRAAAAENDSGRAVVEFGTFGEVTFYAYTAKSMRNYQYRFSIDNAMIFLSKSMGGSAVGNVFVQYGAEFCCLEDVAGRHKALMDKLSFFGCHGRREWLNRVDIACDVHMPKPIDLLLMPPMRVPGGRMSYSIMGNEKDGQTLYLGKRSSRISAAIYQKGKLVQSGVNSWFATLWELADHENIENVYRLEYRFGRDWLREYWGAGNVQLAELSTGSLLRHGLSKIRIGSSHNQPRHSRPHDLFLMAASVPEDVNPLLFNRLKPADVAKASVEDLLVGPVLRALRQFRKASELDPTIPLGDLLAVLSEAVYDFFRVAAEYGVDPLYAPF